MLEAEKPCVSARLSLRLRALRTLSPAALLLLRLHIDIWEKKKRRERGDTPHANAFRIVHLADAWWCPLLPEEAEIDWLH